MKRIFSSILLICILSAQICVYSANDALTAIKNSLVFDIISSESISSVTQDLVLPLEYEGAKIIWESSDSNLIEIHGGRGIVKRPPFGEGYAGVLLSAYITMDNDFAEKRFVIRVKELDADYSYSSKITQASSEFDRAFISSQDITAVTGNLIIPVSSDKGVKIECFSSNPGLIASDGRISFPYGEDKLVTFFVQFICGYERIKRSYPIIIKAKTANDAAEIAKADIAQAIASISAGQNISRITNNLVLPVKGNSGSELKWTSSDTAVLSDTGAVTRGENDKTVTLTVKAEFAGVIVTESVTLTIAQKTVLSSESGGASSTGGATLPKGGFTDITSGSDNSAIFSDVGTEHWAYNAIAALYSRGIVQGSGGSFNPDLPIKRSEAAKMLVDAFGFEGNEDTLLPFDDVHKDAWYYSYVNAAYQNGIVKGMSEVMFGSGYNILRQDLAVMLYNAVCAGGAKESFSAVSDTEFADSEDISEYAAESIGFLKAAGIISGRTNNCFEPKADVTRAETAQMIYAILKAIGR